MRVAASLLLLLFGCSRGGPRPAADARGEMCASCRMSVADARMAAQFVAPGEEPLFFDDIGCLRAWLRQHQPKSGSAAFVADHRTGAWVRADRAVFVHATRIQTPMASGLLGYADAASRDADAAAKDGAPVAAAEVLGPFAGSGK